MWSWWIPIYTSVGAVAIGISLWQQVIMTRTPSFPLFVSGMVDPAVLTYPFDKLLKRFHTNSDPDLQDLLITNVAVHRIQFEQSKYDELDEERDERETSLIRSIFGPSWRKSSPQRVTSAVVTWEDHPIAQQTRSQHESYCSMIDSKLCHDQSSKADSTRDVMYEVEVWVNGWGLDALWHPANRKVHTRDPLLMLSDLPQEDELSIRVRIKVKTTTGVLAGWFATEVDGPWSNIVLLSPTKEHMMEAVMSFLVSNKAFGIVLALTIGISLLVIFHLVIGYIVSRMHSVIRAHSVGKKRYAARKHIQSPGEEEFDHRILEQELCDVRQELADSEEEIRRLMLYRGYGIDRLSTKELKELEKEMQRVLFLIQRQLEREDELCE